MYHIAAPMSSVVVRKVEAMISFATGCETRGNSTTEPIFINLET